MPLSWNEIKTSAIAFSKEWDNTEREAADAKPFLVEFPNWLKCFALFLASKQ